MPSSGLGPRGTLTGKTSVDPVLQSLRVALWRRQFGKEMNGIYDIINYVTGTVLNIFIF